MKACIKTCIQGGSRYSGLRNPSMCAKAYTSSCSVCSCSVCSSSGFLIRYCMLYSHVAYAHLAASSYATRLHTLLPSKATPLNPDISTH